MTPEQIEEIRRRLKATGMHEQLEEFNRELHITGDRFDFSQYGKAILK